MNECVISHAPSPERGARSTESEPATRALLDEELARIVRIVRATLESGSAKKEEKRAMPLWQRAAPFCLEHWALTAFAASVLMLIGAAVGYGASPF